MLSLKGSLRVYYHQESLDLGYVCCEDDLHLDICLRHPRH